MGKRSTVNHPVRRACASGLCGVTTSNPTDRAARVLTLTNKQADTRQQELSAIATGDYKAAHTALEDHVRVSGMVAIARADDCPACVLPPGNAEASLQLAEAITQSARAISCLSADLDLTMECIENAATALGTAVEVLLKHDPNPPKEEPAKR